MPEPEQLPGPEIMSWPRADRGHETRPRVRLVVGVLAVVLVLAGAAFGLRPHPGPNSDAPPTPSSTAPVASPPSSVIFTPMPPKRLLLDGFSLVTPTGWRESPESGTGGAVVLIDQYENNIMVFQQPVAKGGCRSLLGGLRKGSSADQLTKPPGRSIAGTASLGLVLNSLDVVLVAYCVVRASTIYVAVSQSRLPHADQVSDAFTGILGSWRWR